jgi:uncharacterized protein YhhL (DUF1145 family)
MAMDMIHMGMLRIHHMHMVLMQDTASTRNRQDLHFSPMILLGVFYLCSLQEAVYIGHLKLAVF